MVNFQLDNLLKIATVEKATHPTMSNLSALGKGYSSVYS